jgi:hypothetical protein
MTKAHLFNFLRRYTMPGDVVNSVLGPNKFMDPHDAILSPTSPDDPPTLSILSNNSLCVSTHHFLTVLISAHKISPHICILFRRLKLNDCYDARHRVAGKNRPMELELHFSRNEVQVAADFGGHRRRQQAMNHQPAFFIRRHVMHTFITRDFIEEPDVVFGERPFPGNNVANFHGHAFPVMQIFSVARVSLPLSLKE